jgi:hypothetical protein
MSARPLKPRNHLPKQSLYEPVPAWAAGLFDAPAYQRFKRVVIGALLRLGHKFQFMAEDGIVSLQDLGAEAGAELGLENLAKVCIQAAPEEWPRLALWQFRTLLEAVQATPRSFQEVRPLLKARVWSSEDGFEASVRQDIGGGLCAVMVVDEPNTIKTVLRTELAGWPISEDQAWALARDNLRAEHLTPESGRLPADDGIRLSCFDCSAWYFASSHLLLMNELVPKGLPYGVLVAVPRRSSLLYHVIEDGWGLMRACGVLGTIASGMCEEGPASITDRLLWWHEGMLSPIYRAPAFDPARGWGMAVELPEELSARLGVSRRNGGRVN